MIRKILLALISISLLIVAIVWVLPNNQFINLSTKELQDDWSTFSQKKHEGLVSKLEDKGISNKEAILEAFNYQIRELALIDKADEMGITVSKKEAHEYAKKLREMIESGVADDGTPIENYKEHQLQAEQAAKELGLTLEEYWNEYVPANAVNSLKLSKIQEKLELLEENKTIDQIVEEYKIKNSNLILKIKKEVGL